MKPGHQVPPPPLSPYDFYPAWDLIRAPQVLLSHFIQSKGTSLPLPLWLRAFLFQCPTCGPLPLPVRGWAPMLLRKAFPSLLLRASVWWTAPLFKVLSSLLCEAFPGPAA